MSPVAAIDIGSNSVRLLIVGANGAELCREMNITRLAEGVDQTGRLATAAMERTVHVLEGYGALMRSFGVQRARVTGTSAARDADNRQAFFAGVRAAVGSEPELLSGQAEAALAFAGATADQPREAGPFVTLDIGGGSTEFAYGSSSASAPEHSISLDIGCVRMTERFLCSDPPRPAEFDAARAFIQSQLSRVELTVPCRSAKTWLGLAGTVTSLAAKDLCLAVYDPSRTHGHALLRSKVEAMHAELSCLHTEGRARLLLEPKRAPVILGGSVILLQVMHFFELGHILVSERDILDGLVATLRTP